ncbi:MAG: hypothetical protein KKA84_10680 [Bacteroidetes bacterium]|nr:hypothetical protein [Bacteroidota bacterium]
MKLSANKLFVSAFRSVFYNSKFVILLWALSAITSLVITMPLYHIMLDSLGNSFLSDKLASGMDMLWLTQFLNIHDKQLDGILFLFFAAMIAYLVIQNFFSGGLIAIFNSPKKNHILDFFYGCVKFWFRFLKVLLISIFFYGAAFLLNELLGNLISIGFANSENAMMEFILKGVKYILLIFLIGLTAIIADYAKVIMVSRDGTSAFQSIFIAIIFIKDSFNTSFSIFVAISIIGALGAIVYNLIGRFIPSTPYYFMILTFILQQMLIIFRLLIRMFFYSSEVLIFNDMTAEVIEQNL